MLNAFYVLMQLDAGTLESVMPSGGFGVTGLKETHTQCSTEFVVMTLALMVLEQTANVTMTGTPLRS